MGRRSIFAGKAGGAGPGREAAAATYALRATSPAIGAGVALPNHPTHDFAGNPIIMREGRVDLGAVGGGEQVRRVAQP